MLKKYAGIALIILFALVSCLGRQSASPPTDIPAPTNEAAPAQVQSQPTPDPVATAITKPTTNVLPDFLPPEAETTLDLIASDGPFPNRQDGVVFQNREQHLPKKMRGYYHEYTVETPGLNHRGTRRIITGGDPIEIYYYTDDHYNSFREFKVPP